MNGKEQKKSCLDQIFLESFLVIVTILSKNYGQNNSNIGRFLRW